MDEDELNQMLKRRGWTVQAALYAVLLHTGQVINPKNVSKTLRRQGRLSAPASAMFRLLDRCIVQQEELRRLQDFNAAREMALIAEINQLKGRNHEQA